MIQHRSEGRMFPEVGRQLENQADWIYVIILVPLTLKTTRSNSWFLFCMLQAVPRINWGQMIAAVEKKNAQTGIPFWARINVDLWEKFKTSILAKKLTWLSRNDKYILPLQSSGIKYLIRNCSWNVEKIFFAEELFMNCVQQVLFILVKSLWGKM